MKSELERMTPRELWLGLFKLAITLTFGLLLAAFLLSLVFSIDEGKVSGVVINALLLAIAASLLANGVLAVLKIFDWFDARRAKKKAH